MLFESIKGTKRNETPQLKVLEIVFVIAVLKLKKTDKINKKNNLFKLGCKI